MPDRVGVDLPAVSLGSDEVLLECRAELDDAALFGLYQVHLEVEVVLLRVFVVGPARRAVVLHPLEGQAHLAEGMPAELSELPSMRSRPVTSE